MISQINDTIIAPVTAQGVGAIAVIRISGEEAITKTNAIFRGKNLDNQASHTIHYGTIRDGEEILDEVLVSIFRAPKSFTKENVVEISAHGSPYIVRKIIQLFIRNGVRPAQAGEFTKRAFLNGQFDLAQAEAVADLISAESEAMHKTALNQLRGGFSNILKELREKLIHFASLIELELDFGEEDVEFADRQGLRNLIQEILKIITELISSFDLGNVIKNGVPTVIAGKPNAGKSTLLNALLNEEKAIVSEIAGTTRDFIEDELVIEGISFRFIDTAGLRETTNQIEKIGVERTRKKMQEAALVLYLFDLQETTFEEFENQIQELKNQNVSFLAIGNKTDRVSAKKLQKLASYSDIILISAKEKQGLEALKAELLRKIDAESFHSQNTIVTNIRHYESLVQTQESLESVLQGLHTGITGDFLAMDIRHALHYLGEITGTITTDDLLGNIFSKFCIGK